MYEHDKKTMASVERIVGVAMDSHRSTGFSSSNADNESSAYYPTYHPQHKRNITQRPTTAGGILGGGKSNRQNKRGVNPMYSIENNAVS
jgi:hypothetical protein